MSKSILPQIGEPVFQLVQHSFTKKLKISADFSRANLLSYVGVDAIKVMEIGYTDPSMNEIVINKDCKDENGKSMAIIVNASTFEVGKKRGSNDLFVNEADANTIAEQLNKQFQDECQEIIDELTAIYHEYTNVRKALKPTSVK